MKLTCFALCVLGLAVLATADSDGSFVPKAFYKLDNEGHKSNFVEINPHQAGILRRLRRDSSYSGSSSSSSSTYGGGENGGPVYFTSHQAVHSSPGFESRFGGDDSQGFATHTTGVIQDGKVIYKTTKTQKL